MAVTDWSTTAAANQTADPNINWREGQAPSTVNDSARAMMAAIAGMVDDQGSGSGCGGSGNDLIFYPSQPIPTVTEYLFGFFSPVNNTGPMTMKFGDAGTAYPLRRKEGIDLVAGQVEISRFYLCTWRRGSNQFLITSDSVDQTNTVSKVGGTFTGTIRVQAGSSDQGEVALGTGSSYIYYDGTSIQLRSPSGDIYANNGSGLFKVWNAGNFDPSQYARRNEGVTFQDIHGQGNTQLDGSLTVSGEATFTDGLAAPQGAHVGFNGQSGSAYAYYDGGDDCVHFTKWLKDSSGTKLWSRSEHGQPVEQVRTISGGTVNVAAGADFTCPSGGFINGFNSAHSAEPDNFYYRYIQYYRQDVGWVTIS